VVTAILATSGRRKDALCIVMRDLLNYPFIDEIMVIFSDIGPHRRYSEAKKAKNSTIYVQDDDCLIKNLQEIYDNYDKKHVTLGMEKYRWPIYENEQSKMVGWGTFFEKDWVKRMKPYLDEYGEDDIYKRESDRIFTYFNPTKMVLAKVNNFPTATDSGAMCVQEEHEWAKAEAIRRCEVASGRHLSD
jgi:hypothetical protein